MTPRERFLKTLNFEKPSDRLPMVEWAAWWDQTTDRWKGEGLPVDISWDASLDFFGLDKLYLIMATGTSEDCPQPASHGSGIITDEASYEAILPCLYQDKTIDALLQSAGALKERHDRGEIIIRLWLDGFFWYPRVLLGIERHLYAFYDQPGLLHRINRDLAAFNVKAIEALFPYLQPDMVGFAEDLSYNHGPMLSRRQFREFLTPYYQQVIPHIKQYGVKVLVDSDGDISSMIPWFDEAGIEGVYPLERQAGVDLAQIRRDHPRFLMMGGYDKMVMPCGEKAMRAEFERLLPVMRSGGYIPSVDHQTPPGVSLENYWTYIRLFEEYTRRACQPE
jgi:Uroporphyrinogen decarboxylase (URO-D)